MRLAALLVLAGCSREVIELGIDATPVTPPADAPATACRCRIMPCRLASDCALTGGTCGADFHCTGSFATCTSDDICRATIATGVCRASAISTEPCP